MTNFGLLIKEVNKIFPASLHITHDRWFELEDAVKSRNVCFIFHPVSGDVTLVFKNKGDQMMFC